MGRSYVLLHPQKLKWFSWLDWTNVTESWVAKQEIMFMFFTVTQLCRRKRCLSDKETVCGFSLSDDQSIVFLLPLRLFPPSALFPLLLWPGVFPSCVKEGAEMCALSCWSCHNMRYGQSTKAQWYSMSLLRGWSTSSSTQRVSSSAVGGFSLPDFSDLNSKTGTAHSLPGMRSNYYLMLKLSSYTSAARIIKPD